MLPSPPTDEIVSAEAAHLLGVHVATVSRLVARGRLAPSRRLPGGRGHFMFWRADVERLASERRKAAS